MTKKLSQLQKIFLPIFKHYGVIRADIFGSVARGDDTKKSDLDVAITLKKPLGLFTFLQLNEELEHCAGRKVDLVTHASIHPRLKPYISKDLTLFYEEKS